MKTWGPVVSGQHRRRACGRGPREGAPCPPARYKGAAAGDNVACRGRIARREGVSTVCGTPVLLPQIPPTWRKEHQPLPPSGRPRAGLRPRADEWAVLASREAPGGRCLSSSSLMPWRAARAVAFLPLRLRGPGPWPLFGAGDEAGHPTPGTAIPTRWPLADAVGGVLGRHSAPAPSPSPGRAGPGLQGGVGPAPKGSGCPPRQVEGAMRSELRRTVCFVFSSEETHALRWKLFLPGLSSRSRSSLGFWGAGWGFRPSTPRPPPCCLHAQAGGRGAGGGSARRSPSPHEMGTPPHTAVPSPLHQGHPGRASLRARRAHCALGGALRGALAAWSPLREEPHAPPL